MNKTIILIITFILLLISSTYANNESGTGYVWYDKFDSITNWDFNTESCGDESASPELEIYSFGGVFGNVIRSNTAGASCMELDNSDISLQNSPISVNFMTYDNQGYWYVFNLRTAPSTGVNTIFGGGVAGADTFILDATDGSARTVSQDNDWTANTWYNNTYYLSSTFIEYWIDGTLMLNTTLDIPIDISNYDLGFIIRTDGNNQGYFDEYKIWYGRPEDEPTTPPQIDNNLSITLNYPSNNTIFYGDFLNKINVTLSNVNGTANCSIHNDTRWTVSGYDFGNETVTFINNTVITETNFTYQIDCYDIDSYYNLTGAWFIKYNVLNISIYDDTTGDLINVSVSMNLYNDEYYQTYETTNGTIYITGLSNGTYSADFSSDNYSSRGYTLTLGFGEITNLNAYLSSVDGEVILTTRDRETGAVIQGATITVKKFIDSVLTTIYTKDTDITGRIQFGYTTGVKYYFTVTKTGYENKEFILDPVIFSEYSVYLDSTATITDDSDMVGVSIVHTPTIFYEGMNNITVTISNPDGALINYGFNYSYLGNTNSSSGSNAYGSTLQDTFNISGSSWGDKVRLTVYYRLNGESIKSYIYNYEIIPSSSNNTFIYNQNKHYGLGEFERVSIFTLMTVFIGGMFTIFTGAVSGFGVMLLMMGYFVKIGFISMWYVVIPIFAGSIILIWRVSQ